MVRGPKKRAMRIDWERARTIFGNAEPPKDVWQQQFDHHDDVLKRLARTPQEEIDFSDLWYYHHDLTYVELQPELFAYLFPVCLMDWHSSLMKNEDCSHGDSEFHSGVRRGKILDRMLTQKQRDAVYLFFRDSFLDRLDAESSFAYAGNDNPAHGWMYRLNSLGIIMPRIDLLWDAWWSFDTLGRTVAGLQYCSALMYCDAENPLDESWVADGSGGPPYIWANDSCIHDAGWLPENVQFLASNLTVEFVSDRIAVGMSIFEGGPEGEKVRKLLRDLPDRRELLEYRIAEFPKMLSQPYGGDGWYGSS